jgi:GT2 family glycosyltransferase
MTLAIILVNWRNEQQTISQANVLNGWRRLKPHVIVIDNEATGASHKTLAALVETGEMISSSVNLGYGGGNNLGIERALAKGCEYVFLLNSDADLSEDDAARLMKRARDYPNISILGPALREGERADEVLIGGRDIGRHRVTRHKLQPATAISSSGLYAVDYVPGTVFLARASVFKQIGLLDEDYFFSGEIADFCTRAKKSGNEICIDTAVEARHRPESDAVPMRDVLYTYYSLRNRFLYVRKHYTSLRYLYYAYWTAIGAVMVVRALAGRKLAKARAILLALLHAYTHQFGNQNASFCLSTTERA